MFILKNVELIVDVIEDYLLGIAKNRTVKSIIEVLKKTGKRIRNLRRRRSCIGFSRENNKCCFYELKGEES